MVAITIIAGAAIFGYVSGQAGVASQAYGQSVGNSVDFLNEKFTVVDMGMANTTCGSYTCGAFTIWIYNTGAVTLSTFQVILYTPSSPSGWHFDLLFNYSSHNGITTNQIHDESASASGCTISATSYESPSLYGTSSFNVTRSSIGTLELTIPPTGATPTGATCPSFGQLVHSDTYFASVVGLYGNSYTYSQVG